MKVRRLRCFWIVYRRKFNMEASRIARHHVVFLLILSCLTAYSQALSCSYKIWKFRCSDQCCLRFSFKLLECLPCTWKFYLPCGKFLNPPLPRNLLPTATHPDKDRSDWMAAYQAKTLRQMVLPGSHHSGVNRDPGRLPFDAWDITQTMTVSQQLRAGIRFMDFRVATAPFLTRPSVVHNYRYQDFKNVVRDIANFLSFHTKEVVVLRLIGPPSNVIFYGLFKYDWRIDEKEVDEVLQMYHSYIYTGGNPLNKTISSLAGKLVVCQQGSSSLSVYRVMDCQTSYEVTKTADPLKLDSLLTYWVNSIQEERKTSDKFYFAETTVGVTDDEIKRSIVPQLTCFRSGDQALYIAQDTRDLAQEFNFIALNWVYYRSNLRFEIEGVLMDFVNPKMIDLIIRRNNQVPVNWGWNP